LEHILKPLCLVKTISENLFSHIIHSEHSGTFAHSGKNKRHMVMKIHEVKSTNQTYRFVIQYISNNSNFTQFICIWKLLYMFRVVPPHIIRSAYNSIYNICYLSDRYCYLPPGAGNSNGLTNIRCCRYSCLRS